jgi:hypothetical protein
MLKQSLAGVGSFALHPRAALFIACRDRPSRCVLACPAGVVRSRLLFEHHQLESDRRLHHVSVSGLTSLRRRRLVLLSTVTTSWRQY